LTSWSTSTGSRRNPLPEPEVSDLTRAKVRTAIDQTLRSAGVVGVVPTPLEAVGRAAGIVEVIEAADVPEEIAIKKPSFLGRLLGALSFGPRVVYLASGPEPRVRFTHAHELAHKIVPWHEDSHRFDDKGRVFGPVREILETEANIGAAHLLFQGRVFMDRALGYKVGLDAPLALADDFGGSRHASIRYYVENHPDRIALVVAGRYILGRDELPVYVGAESANFRARYGRVKNLVGRRLPASADTPIGEIVRAAMSSSSVESARLTLQDLKLTDRLVTCEAFFNQYSVFVILAETGFLPLGKRIVVARAMPAQDAAATR
jgi:hypothetical protein